MRHRQAWNHPIAGHRSVIVATPTLRSSMQPRRGIRVIAVSTLLLALIGNTGVSPAGDDPAAPLGTNLVAITDYSDEFPFINLMKSARDWIPGRLHECFDCRQSGSGSCVSPTACPVELARDVNGDVSSLNTSVNQVARSVIHAGGDPPGRLPTGRYTMLYDGQGSVSFDGARIVNAQPGRIEFDIVDSATNIILNLTATTPGNHLRNIRLLPPGGVCAADGHRFCDASASCGAGDVCRLFADSGVAEQHLSPSSAIPATVRYATADGTARVGDRDYVGASGTLTFDPGETTKTLTVRVTGDTKPESNETFFVNLTNASGALFADRRGVGTILNDD